MASQRCSVFALVAVFAFGLHVVAQDPGGAVSPTSVQPAELVQGATRTPCAGLVEQEGELWGVGDDFKARFGVAGIEFIPALGRLAPHNFPLQYQLLAVGRGGGMQVVEPAARRWSDLQVEYCRPRVSERYDVRADGLEQSFVFATLPAGAGDLTVRASLTTELQVTAHDGGLRFEMPGLGGFHLGGVTGIDAQGRRAAGTVRYHDGVVDYILPAAFVEAAALPLTVDPLIGSVFTVMGGTSDDQDPDVAFDVTNGVYLVVFERVYSATDYDIHGQRVASNGALVGGRVFIENSTAFEYDPAVCSINVRDHFVVVFTSRVLPNYDVKARSVNASTAAVSAAITVAGGSDLQFFADVSGEATTVDNDAICVWANASQDKIMAAQIDVSSNGSMFRWDTTTIYTSASSPQTPRIDKSGGDTGHHMIVWRRNYGASDYDPQGAIVSRELDILDNLIAFDPATNYTGIPDVDGDGHTWVAAWHVREASGTKNDVVARSCSYAPSLGQGLLDSAITMVEGDAGDNEINPAVCWAGDSYLVGFADEGFSSNYEVAFKSIDSFTCQPCEDEFFLNGAFAYDLNWQGASERSGGGTGDGALLVIETYDSASTLTSDVVAQRWTSVDGVSSNIGGGCGSEGGAIYATCGRSGNAGFAARLVGANANAAAVLVISRMAAYLPCGTCRLIPDPYAGSIYGTATSAYGRADFTAAIPASSAVIGITFYLQWVVEEPVTPGCYLFGSDLSDALRVTIQG